MWLPIAGAIVWAVVAICGLLLPFKAALIILVFATGAIFPNGSPSRECATRSC